MSGKQKQAHRTKGNVKPSSSARAAEMLTSSGGATLGFVGFGALSGDLGYVPAGIGNEEFDAGMDTDFRMTLRKLSKKDATTKLKALQEFSGLCKDKTADQVSTVLPYWPRIYSKVAVDNDRRVREASHQAFEQLVLRVRRNLAPHLKSVMGPWLVAQCDVHTPAATAAKAAFQAAFPPAKQVEAVVFCRNEVFSHIEDNLLKQTALTLSDPKTTEPEDREAKYQRVITSSLSAWRLFMTLIPKGQQEGLKDNYNGLLADNKFWKFVKSQQSMIRGAWYSAMGALCQVCPDLANQHADKLCGAVLHNLDDTDPSACGSLWEAALYVVTVIQNCWKKVNPRKGVLPKLWSLLRKGGGGSAVVIFPNLLPLLSKIPEDIIGEGLGFYQEFFSNIKTGLSQDKVLLSPSECTAVVKAFMECLRYCLTYSGATMHAGVGLQDFLISDQLLQLVEASIVDESPALSTSPLYNHVVDLSIYLQKLNTNLGENPSEDLHIDSVVQTFWSGLTTSCINHIETADTDNKQVLERIGILFEAFTSSVQEEKKKTGSVKIEASPAGGSKTTGKTASNVIYESLSTQNEDGTFMVDEDGPLMCLVCKASVISYRKARHEGSLCHLRFISKLVQLYISRKLLQTLLTDTDVSESDVSDAKVAMAFYHEVLSSWIRDIFKEETSCNASVQDSLVQLVYSVYRFLPGANKLDILNDMCTDETYVQNTVILQRLVTEVLASSVDVAVRQWFASDVFGQLLLGVTRQLCTLSLQTNKDAATQADIDSKWAFLNLAFASGDNVEPLVGQQYMEQIMGELRQAVPSSQELTHIGSERASSVINFVCDVAVNLFSNVKGCFGLPSAEELLLSLFLLSAQHCSQLEEVTTKVDKTWQAGVCALVEEKGGLLNEGGFFRKATAYIKYCVLNDCDSISRLKQLSDLGVTLATSMGAALTLKDDLPLGLTHMSVQALFSELRMRPSQSIGLYWVKGTLVDGSLAWAHQPPLADMNQVSGDNFLKCVAEVAFTSELAVAMARSGSQVYEAMLSRQETQDGSGQADKDEDLEKSWLDKEFLQQLAYAVGLCKLLVKKQRMQLKSSQVVKVLELIEANFSLLLGKLSQNHKKELVKDVLQRSLESGNLWSVSSREILDEVNRTKPSLDPISLMGGLDRLSVLTEPVLHTVQMTVPHWNSADQRQFMELCAAKIISCDQGQVTDMTGGLGTLAAINSCLGQMHIKTPGGDGEDYQGEVLLAVINEILVWREQQDEPFLFSCCLIDQDWSTVSFNLEVMRWLHLLVKTIPDKLTDNHWDFIMCSLVAWIQSISESSALSDSNLMVQSFLHAACTLLTSVAHCMKNVLPTKLEAFPENLMTEWVEFFSDGIYSIVIPLFVNAADTAEVDREPNAASVTVSESLAMAASMCPVEQLKAHKLEPHLVADHAGNLPDNVQTVLNHLCPMLISRSRPTQLAAYKMLDSLMPELPAYDEGKSPDEEKEEGPDMSPPAALMSALEMPADVLADYLQCGTAESLLIEPYTDKHACVTGYLLLWKLLLSFFKGASSELRAEYALFLRNSQTVEQLMNNLFMLMPETPIVGVKESWPVQSPTQGFIGTKNLFAEKPSLEINGEWNEGSLPHLACSVYFQALEDLPAIIRQWYHTQDKKMAGIVNRFTSKYVSPQLCSLEILAVQSKDVDLSNMNIKARPAAREVVAVYTIDEVSMELVVQLPENHPLGPITVESGKRIGVSTTQWRNWMLQMTTYLQYQNGSILEGLSLWKRNVDKRFEGLEDCMICFSVIHGSNCQLPRQQCKTCKKKFHSACLYKWFSTSNNSTCPLCRNLF